MTITHVWKDTHPCELQRVDGSNALVEMKDGSNALVEMKSESVWVPVGELETVAEYLLGPDGVLQVKLESGVVLMIGTTVVPGTEVSS